jgi:hypothetical protein
MLRKSVAESVRSPCPLLEGLHYPEEIQEQFAGFAATWVRERLQRIRELTQTRLADVSRLRQTLESLAAAIDTLDRQRTALTLIASRLAGRERTLAHEARLADERRLQAAARRIYRRQPESCGTCTAVAASNSPLASSLPQSAS